jgi:hypothetical protein
VRRPSLPAGLAAAGLLWSAVAVLDPDRQTGCVGGPLLTLIAVLVAVRLGRAWRPFAMACLMTSAFAVAAWVGPEFRADSPSYYVYLRSAVFDGDLDFTNEWEFWGFERRPRTPTGHMRSVHAAGPALLWSPFYAVAHVYVIANNRLLGARHSEDGYSAPYRRAPVLGTLVVAILGATLLVRMLARSVGEGAASVAVAAAILTSPVLYYLFVMPLMSHGVTFGVAAALLWAWERARRAPSLQAWTLLGALFGLLVLTRWQAAVYGLLLLPLAAEGLLRRSLRPVWLAAAAGAASLAFAPQMVVWRVLWGRFLTLPQGGGFMDWSSPHLADTLISADHGLFSWTPAMLLGAVGLLLGLRGSALLHAGALLVFAATAWVNGGVTDWAAGDAFGARRYDLVVPLAALGLASLISRTLPVVVRFPLAVPAGALLLLSVWNLGLITLFREGRYPGAVPLERVAADQSRNLRRFAEQMLGQLAGEHGRALAYRYFAGEYIDTSGEAGGTIYLATTDEARLTGWSAPVNRKPGEPGFRWALHPAGCVRLPLEASRELSLSIRMRAPRAVQPQTVKVLFNDDPVATAPVDGDWEEVLALVPGEHVVAGENRLCLTFANAAEGDPGSRLTAAIERIRLR